MIVLLLLLALLPLTAGAQYTFGPTRLDNELGSHFYYPTILRGPGGELLCAWAQAMDSGLVQLGTYGQNTLPNGTADGPRIVYEENLAGDLTCPASLQIVPLIGGGAIRLLHHS